MKRKKEKVMFIPRYNFDFDDFIEKKLKEKKLSLLEMREICYKEIDRIDRISQNSLEKYEWDMLVNYRTLLNGLPHFLINNVTSNGEIAEKKYRKIKDILSQNSK